MYLERVSYIFLGECLDGVYPTRQEEWVGAIWHSNEWWVERMMKDFGNLGSSINTLEPEKVIGNEYMTKQAVRRSELFEGSSAISVAKAAAAKSKLVKRAAPVPGTPRRVWDDETLESHLVGASTNVAGLTLDAAFHGVDVVKSHALNLITKLAGQAIEARDIRVYVFLRCSISGEAVTSLAYSRAYRRASYNVTLVSEASPQHIVATVHKYFLATHEKEDRVLGRFALVTKYSEHSNTTESGLGLQSVRRWGEGVVPLTDFGEKCILHFIPDVSANSSSSAGKMYAIPLWGIQRKSNNRRPI